MGFTPTQLLPYPELNDAANVPVDMKELADRLEALLSKGQSLAVAAGLATLTLTNASNAEITVTFPAGRFSAAPAVVATINASVSTWYAYVKSITATNCIIGIRQINGSLTTASIAVGWIARVKG
jgi:hypothetical protein